MLATTAGKRLNTYISDYVICSEGAPDIRHSDTQRMFEQILFRTINNCIEKANAVL